MPRELNDRHLMKTYYVVVEDVSFNARAVNSLFRNALARAVDPRLRGIIDRRSIDFSSADRGEIDADIVELSTRDE